MTSTAGTVFVSDLLADHGFGRNSHEVDVALAREAAKPKDAVQDVAETSIGLNPCNEALMLNSLVSVLTSAKPTHPIPTVFVAVQQNRFVARGRCKGR